MWPKAVRSGSFNVVNDIFACFEVDVGLIGCLVSYAIDYPWLRERTSAPSC